MAEKEQFVINTKVDPENVKWLKRRLITKGMTISQWAEEKINEEAANEILEK